MNKSYLIVLFGASLLLPLNLQANPFGSYDARIMGMGNSGVAVADLGSAAFYNPALLALRDLSDKRFSITLPAASINVADEEGLLQDASDYQQAINNSSSTSPEAIALAKSMVNKPFFAELYMGSAAAFMHDDFSIALNYNRHISASIKAQANDLITYQDTVIRAVGLDNQEVAISLAKSFRTDQDMLAIGITPKFISTTTFSSEIPVLDLNTNSGSTDLFDLKNGYGAQEYGSLDLGIAYRSEQHLQFGFTVRDLINRTFTTFHGDQIRIQPKARIGIAYERSFYTVSTDYDLTTNNPLAFETPTRFLSIGSEFRLYNVASLRLGYLYNSASGIPDSQRVQTLSLGLGFKLYGASLDLGIASNQKSNLSAAFQTGFTF